MASIVREKGKGRQKAKLVKIENKSNLQVTFSKRRAGLFKKASELCTLTGADVAIIVHSPGGKVFSFGDPSVHKVIEKTFMNPNNAFPRLSHDSSDEGLSDDKKYAKIDELNMQLSMLDLRIESEKKRSALLREMEKAERAKSMWKEPIEKLSESQLRDMATMLGGLREKVTQARNSQMCRPTLNVIRYGPMIQ